MNEMWTIIRRKKTPAQVNPIAHLFRFATSCSTLTAGNAQPVQEVSQAQFPMCFSSHFAMSSEIEKEKRSLIHAAQHGESSILANIFAKEART